ncbi:MAG: lycopene cyclase domain-containing protein [Egibacteraceae bacterium]
MRDSEAVERFEYLILLGLCLLITLPLELLLGVRVYRQPKRLALSLAGVAAVFVTWDFVGAGLGHWDYVSARISGWSWWGLPLEEYLFFLVIPLCGILAYEAVCATLPSVRAWVNRRGRSTRDRTVR